MPFVGRLNAITRLISVLLPDPDDPTSAVVVPARAWNDTSRSTGTPGLYSNHTWSNSMSPARSLHDGPRRVLGILTRGVENLVNPVETGKRLGHLRADRRDLDDRRRHEAGEEDVREQIAERHRPVDDRPAAHDDHDDADGADDHARKRGRRRNARHRLRDVAEQLVRALGEDEIFALLGRVGLDDAHATQRLVQPARQLGAELAALAEERTQRAEGVSHRPAKHREHDDRHERQVPVQSRAARRARARR